MPFTSKTPRQLFRVLWSKISAPLLPSGESFSNSLMIPSRARSVSGALIFFRISSYPFQASLSIQSGSTNDEGAAFGVAFVFTVFVSVTVSVIVSADRIGDRSVTAR